MSQRSFASAEYAMKKKRTRREKFLAEMERIVPWARLIVVIEPLYPKSGRVGRPPVGVPKMLRMYCLQQWYGTRRWKTRCTTARRPRISWKQVYEVARSFGTQLDRPLCPVPSYRWHTRG